LASIDSKAFHCEGGSVYALLAGVHYPDILRFIVAYQTISDYLDNLCDRSTSLDPVDFRALHESMLHAVSLKAENTGINYYRFHKEQNDGGYLHELVRTCREVLEKLPDYRNVSKVMSELSILYSELQTAKHAPRNERVSRLQTWFAEHCGQFPELRWYEFAAGTGSTLGIFCLAAYAAAGACSAEMAQQISKAYFPWVQALHILLDYLIDQEEDRLGGDLNFCSYYPDREEMTSRLIYFFNQAEAGVSSLPDARFHHLINRGLIGIYLSDRKVDRQKEVRDTALRMVQTGGVASRLSLLYFRANHKPVS
jgi:tetraprenyl-beta-curcumene synthase